MKGAYVLLVKLEADKEIQVGMLGKLFFKKGFYVYVGSAMNSLEGRIKRHLRSEKKLHWHIDYLLKFAYITDVFYKEKSEKTECKIAKNFDEKLERVKGFGCSDCRCKSHLFYGKKNKIVKEIFKLKMKQFSFFI